MPSRRPFFEVFVQLIIGVLFISISATVTPASVRHLLLPSLALVAVTCARRTAVCGDRSGAPHRLVERGARFVGWMEPRGIVAAATASTFCSAMVTQGIGGASKILPATFLAIVLTVMLYGLTAAPVARRLTWSGPR